MACENAHSCSLHIGGKSIRAGITTKDLKKISKKWGAATRKKQEKRIQYQYLLNIHSAKFY
jgi:hypothetical protein